MSGRPARPGATVRLLGSVPKPRTRSRRPTRWYSLGDERKREVNRPAAWLVTTVSRVCLDVLRSAWVRHERYVGEWLPEPVPGAAELLAEHPELLGHSLFTAAGAARSGAPGR